MEFDFDPMQIPQVDFTGKPNAVSKEFLDFATSRLPDANFEYTKAVQGNVIGLACNAYLTPKGFVQICLRIEPDKLKDGRRSCSIVTWFLPRYHLVRFWYKPDKRDFQYVDELRAKLEVFFRDELVVQNWRAGKLF